MPRIRTALADFQGSSWVLLRLTLVAGSIRCTLRRASGRMQSGASRQSVQPMGLDRNPSWRTQIASVWGMTEKGSRVDVSLQGYGTKIRAYRAYPGSRCECLWI